MKGDSYLALVALFEEQTLQLEALEGAMAGLQEIHKAIARRLEQEAHDLADVPNPSADLLSLAECCAVLGLKAGSDKTLRRAIQTGALPAIQRPDARNRPQYFVRRVDLLHWQATTYQTHRDPRRPKTSSSE